MLTEKTSSPVAVSGQAGDRSACAGRSCAHLCTEDSPSPNRRDLPIKTLRRDDLRCRRRTEREGRSGPFLQVGQGPVLARYLKR